jgi:small neutral amino acid transporter SnatA (MarC family)
VIRLEHNKGIFSAAVVAVVVTVIITVQFQYFFNAFDIRDGDLKIVSGGNEIRVVLGLNIIPKNPSLSANVTRI